MQNVNDNVIQSNFKVGPRTFEKMQLREENLRKVRISRSGGISERLWAYLYDEDLVRYADDNSSGIAIVVCANYSLNGIPYLAYFPVEFDGENAPECNMDTCIDFESDFIMHDSAKV